MRLFYLHVRSNRAVICHGQHFGLAISTLLTTLKQKTVAIAIRLIPMLVLFSVMFLSTETTSYAQEPTDPVEDVVVIRGNDPNKTQKLKGTIVEWIGNRLTIQQRGRERDVTADEILSVQTIWGNDVDSARLLAGQGQFASAIERYKNAASQETRPWARTIINSELVQACTAIDNHGEAIATFGSILGRDPETRFMYLTPLPWTGTANAAAMQPQAEIWIEASQPVVQLIGASWLLTGPRSADATSRLEQIAAGDNANLAALATAQLWRTVINRADESRVARWEQQIARMPRAMRAGPLYLLGSARGQINQTDEAVLDLMRVRILHREQHSLAAAALYKSATLLQNAGQDEQANTLRRELVTEYPDSVWAGQVKNN